LNYLGWGDSKKGSLFYLGWTIKDPQINNGGGSIPFIRQKPIQDDEIVIEMVIAKFQEIVSSKRQ
tara:strand:- start:470 stop:664 length:195 start_codon:yes stop_codon:yes gene_type:complete